VRIVRGWPPNRAAILAALGDAPAGAVYAYGDTIYSPSGGEISLHLLAHEAEHLRQQDACGGPEAWWDRYLAAPAFRLEQEVAAYRAQLNAMNRSTRRQLLPKLARDLSSAMYGRVVAYQDALRLLGGGRGPGPAVKRLESA
jgi:hypothetical protein